MADLPARRDIPRPPTIEDADLVVLNTCHIRERASEKIYSELGKLRELEGTARGGGPRRTLVVAGCVAQAEGAEILRRQPRRRYRRRSAELSSAAGAVERARAGASSTPIFRPRTSSIALAAPPPARIRARGVTAFVTVQEGCDKFCSFCVVPYTRGAETSRPVAQDLRARSRAWPQAGVREITLLGQNVNAYHGRRRGRPGGSLARLLPRRRRSPRRRAPALHDLASQRHGRRSDRAHRDLPALAPYLHLPVQSGSDRILEAMNRRHTRARLSRRVARVRARAAGHRLLLRFHRRLSRRDRRRFRGHARACRARSASPRAYAFKYSSRPGTPAAEARRTDRRGGQERAARRPAGS